MDSTNNRVTYFQSNKAFGYQDGYLSKDASRGRRENELRKKEKRESFRKKYRAGEVGLFGQKKQVTPPPQPVVKPAALPVPDVVGAAAPTDTVALRYRSKPPTPPVQLSDEPPPAAAATPFIPPPDPQRYGQRFKWNISDQLAAKSQTAPAPAPENQIAQQGTAASPRMQPGDSGVAAVPQGVQRAIDQALPEYDHPQQRDAAFEAAEVFRQTGRLDHQDPDELQRAIKYLSENQTPEETLRRAQAGFGTHPGLQRSMLNAVLVEAEEAGIGREELEALSKEVEEKGALALEGIIARIPGFLPAINKVFEEYMETTGVSQEDLFRPFQTPAQTPAQPPAQTQRNLVEAFHGKKQAPPTPNISEQVRDHNKQWAGYLNNEGIYAKYNIPESLVTTKPYGMPTELWNALREVYAYQNDPAAQDKINARYSAEEEALAAEARRKKELAEDVKNRYISGDIDFFGKKR